MGTILSRDRKLAASRKTVTVEVPELDCSIILKELSIKQSAALGNDVTRQLALMIVDENGDRVFTTDDDIENLSEMSAAIMLRLIDAASALNGISKEAVDEALKNLKAPSGGSGSA